MTKEYGPTLPISKETHALKYRGKGENFKDAMARVAGVLSDDEEHFDNFSHILWDMRFLPGGRVQSAIGSPKRVTAFNCFVSGTIADSMSGIMDKAKDAAQTMRLGGGIGYDFSTIRPSGDLIRSLDSPSSGVISFMHIYDSICGTVSSAGNRRGAQMGVLRVDHPDIEEFIEAKTNTTNLTRFNISVGVTDEFMQAVEEGKEFDLRFNGRIYSTVDARYLWDKIMRATWDWAEPGVLFIDRINEMNNLYYCEQIAATNPCLHPDSLIETVNGRVRIADIKEPTLVYTMKQDGSLGITEATAAWKTKENAETLKITTRNGKALQVTPDHEIYIHDRGWVAAKRLRVGDRIAQLCRARRGAAYSGVKLTTEDNRAYRMEHVMIADAVYGVNPEDDVHHIDGDTYNNNIDNLEVLPHSEHSRHTALNDNPQSHQVTGEDGRFLSTGISPKQIIPMPEELRSGMKNNYSNAIVSIEEGETSDVYDLSVPKTHNFIADFSIVHNCGEQPLPPYGACLLGSFNLVKYVYEDKDKWWFDYDKLVSDVNDVVRAMDNVIDSTTYPLDEQEREAKAKRRMGLGVSAAANAGERLGHVYGDKDFNEWLNDVLSTIANAAYMQSALLAKEKGAFPLCNKDKLVQSEFIKQLDQDVQDMIAQYGLRNSHLTSIAPTGTISLCADNISSGIEPVFSYQYDRTIQHPDGQVIERVTDFGYREWGIKGKTADQCTTDEHLGVLAVASKWVDSAVSKTINVGDKVNWNDFKDIYMKAWHSGCKGVTTFRAAGKRYGILNVVKEEPEETSGEACYYDPATGKKTCE